MLISLLKSLYSHGKFLSLMGLLFSDILNPLPGMNIPFDIVKGKGPVIYSPLRTATDVDKVREFSTGGSSICWRGIDNFVCRSKYATLIICLSIHSLSFSLFLCLSNIFSCPFSLVYYTHEVLLMFIIFDVDEFRCVILIACSCQKYYFPEHFYQSLDNLIGGVWL